MATKKTDARHRALGLSDEQVLEMYWHILLARRLDERMWILHRQHEIAFHISGIGHEGTQVGAAFALKKGYDWVHPYYRDLALTLTIGMTPRELMLGVYGKEGEPSSGAHQMPSHFGKRLTTGVSMATNIVMPQLGESVVEGTVGKWLKQIGDKIEQYESVLEVVTDKVTTEIPSPASGTLLQISVPEGTPVKAGTVLAVIGAPGESVAAPTAAVPSVAAPPVAATPAAPTPITSPSRPTAARLTPVVARMIAENNITDTELATIRGTGDGGRVSKKDIENFLKTRTTKPIELPAWEQPGTGELFRPTEEVFGTPTPTLPRVPQRREQGEVIPLSPIHKAIAEHMVRSKQIAPHVTTVHEADMSRVVAFQKAHAVEFEKQGVKLTYTAFFVQAVVAALKTFPIVNATYTEQGVLMKRDLNIGIAVAMDDGLIVPVLKNADEKSLLGIARAVNDLATRAREKRLQPDEVQGGTFTITNYGVFGSLFGTPIINQPQAAIMGVGAIQKRAVVIDDMIAIRPMIYLTLTFDHRLLDGAIGDQFMQKVKRFLEEYPTR